MSLNTLTSQTLIDAIWKTPASSQIKNIVLALVGSLAIWITAKIQIPFYPVPVTMQTLVVLIIGMAYGPKLGTATLLIYFAQGALGLPVFAGTPEKGIGIAYMFGPTGGYLFGFIPAVILVGYLAKRGWDRSSVKTFIAMVLGNIVIYSFGLLWLGTVLGWDKPILEWGLTPFLLGDVLKISIATLVLPGIWKVIGNR